MSSLEENQILREIGHGLQEGFTEAVVITLFYGIFIMLFSASTTTFLRRGLLSAPARMMFAITAISFAAATITFCTHMTGFTILLRGPFVEYADLPLDERLGPTGIKLQRINILLQWTSTIMPIISDGVIVWRAWVLFPGRRWVMVVPLSLLLASAAVALTYLVLASGPSGIESVISGDSINLIYDSGVALSMGTNVTVTSLIAYKLWTHRKFMVNNLKLDRNHSPVHRILFLLVESGVLFCALQLGYIVVVLMPEAAPRYSVAGFVNAVFSPTYSSVSTMYPTIVIALVNTQRSIVDTYNLGPAFGGTEVHVTDRPATTGHLSFALPATRDSAGTELVLGTSEGMVSSVQTVDPVGEDQSEKNFQAVNPLV